MILSIKQEPRDIKNYYLIHEVHVMPSYAGDSTTWNMQILTHAHNDKGPAYLIRCVDVRTNFEKILLEYYYLNGTMVVDDDVIEKIKHSGTISSKIKSILDDT